VARRALKKRLPKEFEALLKDGDLAKLEAVFDECHVDARGGYAKQTALAFEDCPDELARWLVARGADLNAADTWRNTPLHTRSGQHRGRIEVLLELGADVNASGASIGTPLHAAASAKQVEHADQLLARGASVDARNNDGITPLEMALRSCTNIEIEAMVPLARLLLEAGARRTPAMAGWVTEVGKRFEFHRDGFAPDGVAAASAALDALYVLFEVPAVSRRRVHDGIAPIAVKATRWQDQHDELWNLLVPSSGAAATVQGEVIRIAGRIAREVMDNGGGNWDRGFQEMARAFLIHVQTGSPLGPAELARARAAVESLTPHGAGDPSPLAELGVSWVLRNPAARPLPKPTYPR
jgi:hypothetical protein